MLRRWHAQWLREQGHESEEEYVFGLVFYERGYHREVCIDQARARRAFTPINDGPFDPEADRYDELADLSFIALQHKLG